MSYTEDTKALQTVSVELEKIKTRFEKKAAKEREKVNDVYVLVCGEKCYTEEEINEWYACDYITCSQCDKFIEKLEKKKEAAGEENSVTKSERVVKILNNMINTLSYELFDIKKKEEEDRKREERWQIAQAQGCSYQEWLDQEEVSRQSEEYEKLMGKYED